ncbi:MAG: XTP/dITP diphosphatase [Clostridia bacterium]|nr:XTP/dITP diphosphatase [Clostridia bacterium]
MLEFIVATSNDGKLNEIRNFFHDIPIVFTSMDQLGINIEIEENGTSFEENATIKAKTVSRYTDSPVIADDSGLEVEYLNNEPGIYSARFSGENSTDQKNIEKLLKLMEGVEWENRKARFRCVMTMALPDGKIISVEGECRGYISNVPKGKNGFGYDPVFVWPPYNKTFAQLPDNVKNSISHRAAALKKLRRFILDSFVL